LEAIDAPRAAPGGARRPVQATFRREAIYAGPQLAQAPDAVLHFADGFDIKGAVARDELFGRSALTGMHTYDDSLLYVNRPGFPTRDVAITDLAPTILWLLGVKPIIAMDGRVLGEALNVNAPKVGTPQTKTIEARRDFEKSVWNQHLQISRVGRTIYFDEGNGGQIAR